MPASLKAPTASAWLAAALLMAAGSALGQAFPSRTITLVCPWPPGGSTDTHLRKFAEVASKYVGQNIIVENKPGGGGMLGPGVMAKTQKPDGYTLSQLPVGAFRIPHMQKVDWDPLKDFTYIIGLTGYTFGLVVKSDTQFKTLKEVIDYARANPGKFSYGSTGTGTSPHLLIEELGSKVGAQFLHVPFKGNADSTQAILGGHVMAQSDATGWARHVEAGTFRLLVTFGEQRTKWNAPTARELGIDIVSYSPYGIVAPKGMDPKLTRQLHDAFRKALDDPEHLKVLQQFDQVYWYKSSEDYAKWAAATFAEERATIERLGLLAK
ncbi:MAG: tripartite tricarboxylate transporter substrate binding protein [Betaproteobacteria bacterium]|nr:tripartite tricarboxylate transporter substrate binding protein [Betaproteobacteria bacterium]